MKIFPRAGELHVYVRSDRQVPRKLSARAHTYVRALAHEIMYVRYTELYIYMGVLSMGGPIHFSFAGPDYL